MISTGEGFFEHGELYVYVQDYDDEPCPHPDMEIVLILQPAGHNAFGIPVWILLDMKGNVRKWGLSPTRRRKI